MYTSVTSGYFFTLQDSINLRSALVQGIREGSNFSPNDQSFLSVSAILCHINTHVMSSFPLRLGPIINVPPKTSLSPEDT